jgi:hypothetical protein
MMASAPIRSWTTSKRPRLSSSSTTFCVIFWSRPGLPVESLKRGTAIFLMVGSTTVPRPTSA